MIVMARLRNPTTGVVMTIADELATRLRAEGWESADKSTKATSEPTSESTDDKSAAKSASKKSRK